MIRDRHGCLLHALFALLVSLGLWLLIALVAYYAVVLR